MNKRDLTITLLGVLVAGILLGFVVATDSSRPVFGADGDGRYVLYHPDHTTANFLVLDTLTGAVHQFNGFAEGEAPSRVYKVQR